MLFRKTFLDGIRDGSITLAFRRWRRPTVRAGGTLLTPVGELSIVDVRQVDPRTITDADARRAGHAGRAALLDELRQRTAGDLYRIELGALRVDPRIALRESGSLDEGALDDTRERLRRMDARSADGPWTRRTLDLLAAHPGVRAAGLCVLLGQEKDAFKVNVRKLKNLGLTESLEIGYRLSPRGETVLRALRADEARGP